MIWVWWLNYVGIPLVFGIVVSTVTAWVVRRSLRPRFDAIDAALAALAGEGLPATRDGDVLDVDPHARYRRP